MKYANEIFTSIDKTTTFAVEARFKRETADKPLMVFSEKSRFRFILIEGGKAIYANIPVDKLDGIKGITNALFVKAQETVKASDKSEKLQDIAAMHDNPAFTTKFTIGNLKGKTPIRVLAENPENGPALLKEQFQFLQKNADKYPANKKIMEAIRAAVALSEEERNQAIAAIVKSSETDETNETNEIVILNEDIRPIQQQEREDGMCFCYSLLVAYDKTRNYPVTVKISNFYAPVTKKENGMLNVAITKRDKTSEIHFSKSLTLEDWATAVGNMSRAKDAYFICNFASAYAMMDQAIKEAKAQTAAASLKTAS